MANLALKPGYPDNMYRIITALFLLFTLFSFSTDRQRQYARKRLKEEGALLSPAGNDSRQLAKVYCGMCHLFPEPSLLDKKTWLNGVLPNMGLRLGIREPGTDPYAALVPEEKDIIRQLNIYPEKPLLTKAQWDKIVKYYEDAAPETLPQIKTDTIYAGTRFTTDLVYLGEEQYPKTTLLKFDTLSRSLYLGDAQNMLYILNDRMEFRSAWFTETPPVDIDFPAGQPPRLLTIGVFSPSDQHKGRLLSFDTTGSLPPASMVHIDQLPRPVQFATGYINMDGKEDVVVCGFGNNKGELAWYESFDPSRKHVLKAFPGARKVEIKDMNGDGKPDIIVLMAQAWEEISIFYNNGNGTFREERVLQFPPVYGVSYFETADFNNDGYPDILLTNGDNWDYSPIEKNYHGVRIFLNNGKNKFTEKYFFPLMGASKAIARDFDGDGDPDIAVVSLYSRQQLAEHNFIYLENNGNLDFKPFAFPDAASGKWLTMEAADLDNDGYMDIILGSYIHTVTELTQLMANGITSFPQLLVLRNKGKGQ